MLAMVFGEGLTGLLICFQGPNDPQGIVGMNAPGGLRFGSMRSMGGMSDVEMRTVT